jgi:hypothetical protein
LRPDDDSFSRLYGPSPFGKCVGVQCNLCSSKFISLCFSPQSLSTTGPLTSHTFSTSVPSHRSPEQQLFPLIVSCARNMQRVVLPSSSIFTSRITTVRLSASSTTWAIAIGLPISRPHVNSWRYKRGSGRARARHSRSIYPIVWCSYKELRFRYSFYPLSRDHSNLKHS